MKKKFPDLELILIESGGDNLAATFSPELVDLTIYMIEHPELQTLQIVQLSPINEQSASGWTA